MRNKRSTVVGVGIFLSVGIAILFFIVALLGREQNLFRHHYTLKAHFQDVSGLRNGAFVQLAGLNVGYVDTVSLKEREGKKEIEVVLKIDQDFQEQIREDSVVSIQTQGLLGDKYIYITLGSVTAAALPEGSHLMGQERSSWLGLAEEVQKTAKSLRETMEAIRLDPQNRENLGKAMGHMESLLAGLDRGEGTLGALLKDPSLYQDIRSLLGHANRNRLLQSWIRSSVQTPEKKP